MIMMMMKMALPQSPPSGMEGRARSLREPRLSRLLAPERTSSVGVCLKDRCDTKNVLLRSLSLEFVVECSYCSLKE
jgi:hypothetical protein